MCHPVMVFFRVFLDVKHDTNNIYLPMQLVHLTGETGMVAHIVLTPDLLLLLCERGAVLTLYGISLIMIDATFMFYSFICQVRRCLVVF